jgi:hypothetical protein
MVIIETSIFTRDVKELLTDDDYRQLQAELVLQPSLGAVIRGSGGIRKVRWAAKGHGKRGGVRVIYYWAVSSDRLLMLLIYPKNERDDLSNDQLRVLRRMVEEEFHEG